jgi:nicotinic acid phosphoribosyltransferase
MLLELSIQVYSLQEGTVCFPRVPLMRVEGPLAAAQVRELLSGGAFACSGTVCMMAGRVSSGCYSRMPCMELGAQCSRVIVSSHVRV